MTNKKRKLFRPRRFQRRLYNTRRAVVYGVARAAPTFWGKRVNHPILMFGMARSGTTITSDLLSLHRDVANWSEANMVWDPTGWHWSASKRETLPLWAEPEAFMARWARDAAGREEEIRAVFGLFQFFKGKRFLLNKAPHNVWRLAYILDVFPEAKLIHIVRDGRAVVNSYMTRQWPPMEQNPELHKRLNLEYTYEELAARLGAFWRENLEVVARQDEALKLTERGIMLEVTYEELCTDMRGTLERICQHTGISPDRFSPAVWETKVENRNYKWHERLRPEAIDGLITAMQPAISERGYVE